MRRLSIALHFIALTAPTLAFAGCIGPVIMGECQGQVVQWDTHPQGASNVPPAPSGFYYDRRGTDVEQMNPGAVNQSTGRDAHDVDMDAANRARCNERRVRLMQQGVFINCQ